MLVANGFNIQTWDTSCYYHQDPYRGPYYMACDLFEYDIVNNRLECESACSDAEKLNNLKFYTDGFMPEISGIDDFLGLSTCISRCRVGCGFAADLSWTSPGLSTFFTRKKQSLQHREKSPVRSPVP